MISADSTFQLRYIHYFLDTVLLYHNRLQYSVITTFICSGKPTNHVTHFIMTFTLLRSSGTKPTVSPRSASAVLGLVTQSCPILCDPMDCSPPGFSVHGILQARMLECVAISFSSDLPDPGIKTGSPALQADSSANWATGKAWSVCASSQFLPLWGSKGVQGHGCLCNRISPIEPHLQ